MSHGLPSRPRFKEIITGNPSSSFKVSIRPQYEQEAWSGTRLQLRRWQRGETGLELLAGLYVISLLLLGSFLAIRSAPPYPKP